MVNECVEHLSGLEAPHSDGGVTRSRDDDVLVVLQAEHRSRVARQHLHALQRVAVPNLDGVVAESADDAVVVVL